MIPHLRVAQACQELYSDPAPVFVGNIAYSAEKIDGIWLIVPRGSQTAGDWLRDFSACPVWTPLGFLHAGFWDGMQAFHTVVKSIVGASPFVLGGHSLAGAETGIEAGLCALDGMIPVEVVTFASPRPGFPNLRRVIEKAGITKTNYRFRNDPVPLVPFPVDPLMPWCHIEPAWVALDAPTEPHNLDPLRDHSITNYIAALS